MALFKGGKMPRGEMIGGQFKPPWKKSEWVLVTMEVLLQIMGDSEQRFRKVRPAPVMEYLDQRYGNDRLSFRHLSHSAFLSLLNKIALLVTSPGLTATYEAFVYGVPIRFLPAQNHSQALMQRKYIKNGFADIPMAWSCFYPQCVITDDMPQELGVKMVMDAIETFSRDSEAQEKADDILTEMLTREPPGTHHQKKCFGMDINGDGASQVKAIIAEILS